MIDIALSDEFNIMKIRVDNHVINFSNGNRYYFKADDGSGEDE